MIAAEEIVAGSVADVQAAGVAADVVGAAFEDELFVWFVAAFVPGVKSPNLSDDEPLLRTRMALSCVRTVAPELMRARSSW